MTVCVCVCVWVGGWVGGRNNKAGCGGDTITELTIDPPHTQTASELSCGINPHRVDWDRTVILRLPASSQEGVNQTFVVRLSNQLQYVIATVDEPENLP